MSTPLPDTVDDSVFKELLSDKQMRFLEAYVRTGKALNKAMKEANYLPSNKKNLLKLLDSEEGREYIAYVTRVGIDQAALTIQEVIGMARQVYSKALEDADYKPCMESVRFLGTYMGMLTESGKTNPNSTDLVPFSTGDSPADLEKDTEVFKKVIATMNPSSTVRQ